MPIISLPMIRLFLGYAHAYTTVGLEVQASGFSCGRDGVIRYLSLFPQINGTSSVSEDDSSEYTEYDAIMHFQNEDKNDSGEYFQRCWIHTHPRHRAFMSPVDIYQMYRCETSGTTYSFSMVISPRIEGLNVLVVRLTEDGMKVKVKKTNRGRSKGKQHASSQWEKGVRKEIRRK